MVNRVVMPSIVGESADVGRVDPSLGTGNQQDDLPAKIDSDEIAKQEKLIRDDYLMAKELDPDDPSVCFLVCSILRILKIYLMSYPST